MSPTQPQGPALFWQSEGDGPPVVLLHGLFGAGGNLAALARQLAPRYRVLRVDLRNHGRSPHCAAMSYPLMARDVLDLLDGQQIPRAAVIGHSMGGKVAMELALSQAERVAALVVVDIAPVAYAVDRHDAVFAALQGVDLNAVGSRADADAALATHLADPGLRQFLLTNLHREGAGYSWRINLPGLLAARPALAAAPAAGRSYTGPALFVRGAASDYITERAYGPMRDLFPGARLRSVEGAGHWVHAERPAAFAAAVTRFLQRSYPAP